MCDARQGLDGTGLTIYLVIDRLRLKLISEHAMSDKREQIEAHATRAIQSDGLKSVSFRTLADEVGVKSSSVHYHFRTKGDLARSVVERYTESFRLRLDEIARSEATLSARLAALVDVFDEVLANDDLCLCGMMAAEVRTLDDTTRAALARFFTLTEAWVADAVRAHAESAPVRLAPEEFARIFVAGLEGATLVDRVGAGHDRLDAMRKLADALID